MAQKRNPQLVDILSSDFQRRRDPGFSFSRIVAAHLALPELLAFWGGDQSDRSGLANHLTAPNGSTTGTARLIPYVILASASNQYETWVGDREAVLYAFASTLAVSTGALRVESPFQTDRRLLEVRLRCSTAPTGAAIIVDVLLNGASVFAAPADRPQIAATAFSGSAQINGTRTWADGEYLTVDIIQVGSTIAGSDMVVEIVYS